LRLLAACVLVSTLVACSSARESAPTRTATEQLLIAAAAERSIDKLDLQIPAGAKVFVDATHFEGYDSKYATGTVRDRLLRHGGRLVNERGQADVIVEIRAGALSVDESTQLVGLPSTDLPFPASQGLSTPEVALFKRSQKLGVAKIAATSYSRDGALIASGDPAFGSAHRTRWTVLLLIGWTSTDLEDVPGAY